jgi:hypothetical protein
MMGKGFAMADPFFVGGGVAFDFDQAERSEGGSRI